MPDTIPAFDLDAPQLPRWIRKAALGSGGYPYAEKLDGDVYDDTLQQLQVELTYPRGVAATFTP